MRERKRDPRGMQEINKKEIFNRTSSKTDMQPYRGGGGRDFRSICMDGQQLSITIYTKYTEINKNTDYNGAKDTQSIH